MNLALSIIVIVMVNVKKEDNGNKLQWHMQLCICHHHMLLTPSIITELGSVFNVSKKSRRKCIFDQCLSWHTFAHNTPYAQNSIDTYVCLSDPSRSL